MSLIQLPTTLQVNLFNHPYLCMYLILLLTCLVLLISKKEGQVPGEGQVEDVDGEEEASEY